MTPQLQLIETLYTAFKEADYATFATLCHPELEWIQNEGFPYGGHHHGAEAVVEGVFRTLARHWEPFRFDVQEKLDAGDHVVVIGAYEGTHRESGKSFRADTVHVFDIENGKVRRFRQFTDTALVRDAVA